MTRMSELDNITAPLPFKGAGDETGMSYVLLVIVNVYFFIGYRTPRFNL